MLTNHSEFEQSQRSAFVIDYKFEVTKNGKFVDRAAYVLSEMFADEASAIIYLEYLEWCNNSSSNVTSQWNNPRSFTLVIRYSDYFDTAKLELIRHCTRVYTYGVREVRLLSNKNVP